MNPVEKQLQLQREAFGVDPPSLVGDAKARFIRENIFAAEHELHELADCYDWKPWSPPDRKGGRKRTKADALDEAADIFHFFLNLLNVEGWTWEQFLDAYYAKVDVNFERVRTGARGKMIT